MPKIATKISDRVDELEKRVCLLEERLLKSHRSKMAEVNAAYNYFKTHSTKAERDKIKTESNPDWIAIAEKMKQK